MFGELGGVTLLSGFELRLEGGDPDGGGTGLKQLPNESSSSNDVVVTKSNDPRRTS
jgi:hypothetical protein